MLAGMKFSGYGLAGSELVGLIVAVSFAAGLNVYATVATLGLLAHAGCTCYPVGGSLRRLERCLRLSSSPTKSRRSTCSGIPCILSFEFP